jgi:hypothetical protein
MSMTLRQLLLALLTAASLLLVQGEGVNAGEVLPTPKQSVAGGGVTVDVTFLKERAEGPTFQVVLDSHSGSVDGYRFEEIVRLRDGRGGEMSPAAVESAKGSGHHREATVRFAWPEPRPQSLELIVKGVAGVPERVFRWAP